MTRRAVLLVTLLLAALGTGWLCGASGSRDAHRALRGAELQRDRLERESLVPIDGPAVALWGVGTQRSLTRFATSAERMA